MSRSNTKYSCKGCGAVRYFQLDFCTSCRTAKLRQEFYERAVTQLKAKNVTLHTAADIITGNKIKVDVTNHNCGHRFEAQIRNLMSGATVCSVCGPKKRMAHALKFFMEKYTPDDPTDFLKFKRKVRNLTEQVYKANIDTINPARLPRARPDTHPNAHQLDHKVSIFEAYKQGWTPEQASALENLQMLPAIENMQKQRF